MDKALYTDGEKLLDAAPCSVEMPAGTGKTHLLAAAAAIAGEKNQRTLILTHTNAGVDAIRKRLRRFGVPTTKFRVDTITGWAFSLVRSYSMIANISVSDVPDWTKSDGYLSGATSVARSDAIAEVLSLSFDYLFVDEYQDCTLVLHEFIMALVAAIPKSVILGDRLQAIFTFTGPMATWDGHVAPNFPEHALDIEPHRWSGYNINLGQWLLDIRSSLNDGSTFDFTSHAVPGLNYVSASDPRALTSVAHSFRDFDESVVLLDKWPNDIATHASRLGGSYSVMEDISGNFMRTKLDCLPPEGDPELARWFADFAKACVVGLSGIDTAVLRKLEQGQGVTHYKRPGLESILRVLDELRQNPTYTGLTMAAKEIGAAKGLRIYRWEAWNDTREAIAMTIENGEPAVDNLAKVRDRLRQVGRRGGTRIASRTLLVKGLEYDHVVIADLSKMSDPCNLYVALSRARKSVTVLGASPRIMLKAGG
ncbi:UvrD-helicase domain-containing protein [Vreelandella malpeensis]|uniref:DNA 3'-5' helicase II n=1 Tax=Vreelandella malpeensis TaxID=1172368 RepID=A0ABS8DR89_9GAMM|nr:UvrD-helicase domain-containing protein [Halomonas malpeensis]MCB8888804.1 UvrD-helicase domain-containing protein [Halomonas malpeensis]